MTQLELQKNSEPKFTINVLGKPAQTIIDRDRVCIIYRSGLYRIDPDIANVNLVSGNQIRLQHHPQTVPTYQIGAAAGSVIESGPRTRVGDTIEMTGLDICGYLTLGKGLANATVHIGLYKADVTVNTVPLLPRLDAMTIRRQHDFTEVPNKITSRTFTLNHSANGTATRRKFQIYHRFKKPRRVKYNQGQTSDQTINEARYMDDRYYLVMFSDTPDEVVGGGIGIHPVAQLQQLLDKNITFYGRYTAYYRDI